ncbi:T9SS type A sorting domain-containing protein [bacterium]|nr:T9SS type A sorting domain-containing protein [bacterium]
MKALHFGLILLVLVSTSLAGEWHVEDVDPSLPDSGSDTSIGLDSADIPYVAYYNEDRLLLAHRGGGNWSIETVDDEGPFRYYVSLVLDSQDRPRIAYFQWYPDSDLKYARWTGTEWLIETVDAGDAGPFCSLALDSSDRPHIAYFDWGANELKYARWDGDEWLYEHVDTGGDTCFYISLALDSNDHPHISYQKRDDENDLRYAHWDGSEWRVETVDAEDITGYYSSIALDSQDRPHISYRYDSEAPVMTHLRYAHWDGSQWRIETVDSDGLAGGYTSIALDSADRPHISYHEYLSDDLRYTHWDGERWLIEDVDLWGIRTSIEVDSHDQPHISYLGYCEVGGIGIKYAWYYPYSFHLVSPEKGEIVTTTTPTLDWTDDDNPDLTGYTLWWGTDPNFDTYNEVTGIGESEYTISGGIEDEDRIYWRVKSLDSEGGEYWAEEMDWHFNVEVVYFHLLSPEKGEVVDTTTPTLDWQDQKIPNLESYTLWWGEDPDFDTYNEVTDIGESKYTIADGIQDGDRIWWRVKSIDEDEEEYWAVEMDWYFDVDTGGGVDIVDFVADAEDEGILVNWRIEGDSPAGLRVLRSVGDAEPVAIHHNPLPGSAVRWLDNQVEASVEYVYWLEVTEADGTMTRFGPTEPVTVPEYIPELILYAAYPNPSREVINFVFSLPDEGWVTLSVYDLSGRRVASLVSSDMTAGRHEVSWSCADVESGVYLYRLETGADSITQRLVIAR